MALEAKRYDVMVIGGGPAGYSAAISAAKEGLSVLLFEENKIGGTCLNIGCIPTKYLLDKAKALHKVRCLAEKGILKEQGYYSFKKIQKGREEVMHRLTSGVEYLLRANNAEVVHGHAIFREEGKIECDGTVYEGKDIIIATGSVPAQIPVEGAEYALTSTEALALGEVPERMAVIGGGVIGMELASAYSAFGSKVTVIEALPAVFPEEDETEIAYLKKQLKNEGILLLCGTKVQKICKEGQSFRVVYKGEEEGVIDADIVLMTAGRKANLSGIEIDTKKIPLAVSEKGEIKTDAYMQTSIPHVYAIGDVSGGIQLAHAAYAKAEAAVAHILGRAEAADLEVMPRCIYTIPPYAAVGLTLRKAGEQGIDAVRGTFQYGGNGMALAEDAEGMVAVVMDKENMTTLGVQIVGEGAPEMIAAAALAVKRRMTLKEWRHLIIAHPSLSEMLREAALDCFGKSVHGAVK